MAHMIPDPLVSRQEADLHFDPLLLDCQGTWAELLERLKASYTRKITQAPFWVRWKWGFLHGKGLSTHEENKEK